jgi:hypothetical protein
VLAAFMEIAAWATMEVDIRTRPTPGIALVWRGGSDHARAVGGEWVVLPRWPDGRGKPLPGTPPVVMSHAEFTAQYAAAPHRIPDE